MRELELIKGDYNHRHLIVNEEANELERDKVLSNKVELVKKVYKSDEIVDVTVESELIAEEVTNSFRNVFESRGGVTEEQVHFAMETSKIVFGKLKEDIITVVPAPCGFGKSSITLEILQKQIERYKKEVTKDGIIIVTDRLDSLRKTEADLESVGLEGYTYLLEGWNEQICLNKKVKMGGYKSCTPAYCSFFSKCKISKQQNEQVAYPILLITNARLRESFETIKEYSKWDHGNRTILLIDERPDVLNNLKVTTELLNSIATALSKLDFETPQEKTTLENKFNEVSIAIANKIQELRDTSKRFLVTDSINNSICKNDSVFVELWNKYMKNAYKWELEHIHTVLIQGGFYVFEKKTEFISTIGSRDLKELYCDTFKTIIFDGTALYDPQYLGMYDKGSLKFLDIENTRIYDNLTINVYNKHKLSKTSFNQKDYLINACASFINNKMAIGVSANIKVYHLDMVC